ncbi:hypothetical protein C6Y62_11540 [Hyphomicrobium sulfonivorans]|nr:hypothetical protein [Hyphomicrobium sulfonivorans]
MRMSAAGRQPITISRAELYQAVWAEPMRRLAAKFAISPQRLAKICEQLEIPVPPRGEWGKLPDATNKPALKAPGRSIAETITITSTHAKLTPGGRTKSYDGTNAPVEFVHPAITDWLASSEFLARRPYARSLGKEETVTKYRKELCFLDRLFHAAEKKGLWPVMSDFDRIQFQSQGERINCVLSQRKAYVQNGALRQFKRTSELIFQVNHSLPPRLGGLLKWAEQKDGQLEKHIGAIVDALLECVPVIAEDRVRSEAEAERRRDQALKAEREAQHLRREHLRRQALLVMAERHRSAQALQELIVRMEREAEDTSHVVDGQTITDWLAWARRQLVLSDPLSKGIANLFEEVAASAHAKD